MDLTPRPLDLAAGALNGLSERLVASHHTNNYGGVGQAMAPAMALALEANFGSVDRWRSEVVGMGKALGGGSGWVLLTFLPRDGSLVNQWAADHTNALAGGVPILALDMYEHAYHLDYGAAAAAYVDVFMRNVDWSLVYARYQAAVHAASEPFAANADDVATAQVLDVRRAGMFEKAETVIPGASWRDPAAVARWARDVPRDKEIVVYCVYGHEVGRATALRLRAQGVRARFLSGGIDAWQAAGRSLDAKDTAS